MAASRIFQPIWMKIKLMIMTIFCTYNLGDEVKRENLKTNQSNSNLNWTKASITADKKSRTYTKTEEILDGISFNLAQEIYNPDMRLE